MGYLINGREYEWADLTLIAGGRDMVEFRGFTWKRKIEREGVYAKGREANSIQSGNIAVEGEIVALKSGYDKLANAGGGTILSLNIDLMLSYGNPSEGNAMTTKRISGVRFTEEGEEWKQGDKFAEIKMPFLALKVK
ncbi:hypothetical protein EIB75_10640 [Epilithonimonas vandammei]|uniref:Uncharacterized protein n=1 Tax=Epilithonimonas vandammei TaxID=2487072 RepID=A0A3G8ZF23_9FLAO|nr:hypothetical protein [Epilithonimonas vandammei]AZI53902.1 hypothetical protein EIB75_00910 [Epilithonimonas vandammei]AZI55680.1 hypothetical protein EIB75_10640 [Epilithonimonas vandammei]